MEKLIYLSALINMRKLLWKDICCWKLWNYIVIYLLRDDTMWHFLVFHSLQPHGLQHTRLLCPPLFPGICSNSCPLNQWCYVTISSSTAPFPFCLKSFPASGSFPNSWPFISADQAIGASASASVIPMNIQGWFPLGMTGLISLQSKGLSKVHTTIQKHHCGKQFTITSLFSL